MLPRGRREKSLGSTCPLYLRGGVSGGWRAAREIALQGFLLVVANNRNGKSLRSQFVSFYLAGKHGGEGDTWGDFGFVRLCVIHWRWLEGGCACSVQSSGEIDV